MTKIPVYYLSLKPETPCNDYWDYAFVNDFIDGKMWQPPNFPDFEKHETNKIINGDKAIVLIPARHHAGLEKEIKNELIKLNKAVVFLLGDEEAEFNVELIEDKNTVVWVQNPHPDKHDKYNRIGTGYPPQSQVILPKIKLNKETDIFFAGQITHKRRNEMNEHLSLIEIGTNLKVRFVRTKGFTQGLKHEDYYTDFVKAKVAPCPSGAVIPDSFRLYEALEAMTIPIADEVNPTGTINEYWNWLFYGVETPFPKIKNWAELLTITEEILEDYPSNLHRLTSWWILQKRKFAYDVCKALDL